MGGCGDGEATSQSPPVAGRKEWIGGSPVLSLREVRGAGGAEASGGGSRVRWRGGRRWRVKLGALRPGSVVG